MKKYDSVSAPHLANLLESAAEEIRKHRLERAQVSIIEVDNIPSISLRGRTALVDSGDGMRRGHHLEAAIAYEKSVEGVKPIKESDLVRVFQSPLLPIVEKIKSTKSKKK